MKTGIFMVCKVCHQIIGERTWTQGQAVCLGCGSKEYDYISFDEWKKLEEERLTKELLGNDAHNEQRRP